MHSNSSTQTVDAFVRLFPLSFKISVSRVCQSDQRRRTPSVSPISAATRRLSVRSVPPHAVCQCDQRRPTPSVSAISAVARRLSVRSAPSHAVCQCDQRRRTPSVSAISAAARRVLQHCCLPPKAHGAHSNKYCYELPPATALSLHRLRNGVSVSLVPEPYRSVTHTASLLGTLPLHWVLLCTYSCPARVLEAGVYTLPLSATAQPAGTPPGCNAGTQ